jgi:hypothetical protein
VLIDPYVPEKLRELDADLARRAPLSAGRSPTFALSPVVRMAGRVLRRMGEGLESWAAPRPTVAESDGAHLLAAGQTTGSSFRPREEGC